MKDLFSAQAAEYARFRPNYPAALFSWLFGQCCAFERAWDAATGNGRIAVVLAERFARVDATDASAQQLQHARPHPNICYSLGAAEPSIFPDRHFDLIAVGQAAHWFDLDRFYGEVRRTLKPGGLIVLLGYGKIQVAAEVDVLIEEMYSEVLGTFWDEARHLVEDHYRSLFFPFDEIPMPSFYSEHVWSREHLLGYIDTWFAARSFLRERGSSPYSTRWLGRLDCCWPVNEKRTVRFPIFGRIGRVS